MHTANGCRTPRPSAISQALRAICDHVEVPAKTWDLSSTTGGKTEYRIRVAADRETRERAFRLAHRSYRSRGYTEEDSEGLCVWPYDARPETLVLLAEDAQGRETATLTLVFDSTEGLPCDEVYGPEVRILRAQGRGLAEVTRLAIDGDRGDPRILLLRLFNFAYVYARCVQGLDDLLIEVNPRHTAYYTRLLLFRAEGPERPCPRVRNAPAVLLRLDLMEAEFAIGHAGDADLSERSRAVAAKYFSGREERSAAEFLVRSHRPMSEGEMVKFGLLVGEAHRAG